MTKVIFALLSPEASTAHALETALSPALRDAVRHAGARRVQVNVIDDAFTEAVSLHTLTDPIVGTIAVWVDGDRTAVTNALIDVLTDAGVAHHGWEIDETEVVAGPVVADGERVPAMANLAFLRKPADLPYEQWRSIWQDSHTQIAIDTQDTFGYVQNRVTEAVTTGTPDIVAIVEELFHESAATDWHVFYGSGGDPAELKRRMTIMKQSCDRFGANKGLDLISTSRRTWSLA